MASPTSSPRRRAALLVATVLGAGALLYLTITLMENSNKLVFLLPVAIFTFLLRNHLLRGMSFGAIRK